MFSWAILFQLSSLSIWPSPDYTMPLFNFSKTWFIWPNLYYRSHYHGIGIYIYNQSYIFFEFHPFDLKSATTRDFLTWWATHLKTIQREPVLDVLTQITQGRAFLPTKIQLSVQDAGGASSAFSLNKGTLLELCKSIKKYEKFYGVKYIG